MRTAIASVTRRYSRRALVKPNVAYFLWRFVANGVRTGRALLARAPSGNIPIIARELATRGIVAGPSDRFLGQEGRAALAAATHLVLQASRSDDVEAVVSGASVHGGDQKKFLVRLASYPDGIAADDPLLQVALDTTLLQIVASYLGLWPCLYSVEAWLNYPTDAPPETSQLWHRDPEDLKLIKAFIYLVDVDDRCGPFTYIPKTQPFGAEVVTAQRLEKKKRVPDDRMARVFPVDSWQVCTGTANTMILADTVGYHRGGKPVAGRRVLITFTYTSGLPITERPLSVLRMPTWISSDIQRWAIKPLLGRAPHSRGERKQKNRRMP